jgi:hypothetical protein
MALMTHMSSIEDGSISNKELQYYARRETTTPGISMADSLSMIDVLVTKQLDYLHVSLNYFWTPPRRPF